MPKNAGFKGFQNIPTYSSAPGLWSVRQVNDALKAGPWPKLTLINYLIVAGGGGGGGADNQTEGGGGGGGGGFRTGDVRVNFGVGISVSIGTGGAAGPTHPTAAQLGSRGGDSSVGTTVSRGGGGGGTGQGVPGQNGGSGGGSNFRTTTVGLGNTPATVPAQGFNGRRGIGNDGGGGGGGGGVASGAIYLGGPGGTSSLSGSSATYSVGGQGGRGISTAGYNAGGTNTGTGGAGGYGRNSVAGGDQTSQGGRNGGSGIVIIKYPDGFPALTVGAGLIANPPVVSGGYRTYVFTSGSGTISF